MNGVLFVTSAFVCIVALPVFVSAQGNHGGSASDYKGAYLSGYYRSGSYWMNRVLEDITGITSTSVKYGFGTGRYEQTLLGVLGY